MARTIGFLAPIFQMQVWRALSKLYLFGYPLDKVLEEQVLERMRQAAQHGFCYECAAAIMLALQDDESAELVWAQALWGTEQPRRYMHAWVELTIGGKRAVIDPIWIEPANKRALALVDREDYYQFIQPQSCRVITHAEFWQCGLSGELCDYLRDPQRSREYSPLLSLYEPFASGEQWGLAPVLRYLTQQPDFQRCVAEVELQCGRWWPADPQVLFDEVMQSA